MSKQVTINQATLEFRGAFGLANNLTAKLERRLQRANWKELLKPVLRGMGADISVVDSSGPKRGNATGGRKTRKARQMKGNFCVEIARVSTGTHVFRFSNTTETGAIKSALAQAGDHEFSEQNADYEVQVVWPRR
jgi:hypothetical protein